MGARIEALKGQYYKRFIERKNPTVPALSGEGMSYQDNAILARFNDMLSDAWYDYSRVGGGYRRHDIFDSRFAPFTMRRYVRGEAKMNRKILRSIADSLRGQASPEETKYTVSAMYRGKQYVVDAEKPHIQKELSGSGTLWTYDSYSIREVGGESMAIANAVDEQRTLDLESGKIGDLRSGITHKVKNAGLSKHEIALFTILSDLAAVGASFYTDTLHTLDQTMQKDPVESAVEVFFGDPK